MSTDPTGGPAFPHGPLGDTMHGEDGRVWHQYQASVGMTLRDWFAGQALVGILADGAMVRKPPSDIAKMAYVFADAMLAEREKGTQ